jgi:integrase
MEWNLIARNPAAIARPPRKVVKEMRTLDVGALLSLVQEAPSKQWAAFFLVAATTGMRRGEVMGLRWADLDLDRRSVKVQRSAQRIKGSGMTLCEPKTARGRRSIALTMAAAEALRAHRSDQAEHRLKLGPLWKEQDLVFPNDLGGLLEEATVTRVFKRTLSAAGLPAIRLHDLRHTAATMLMEQAINPKVVQEMLGHSTIAITLDIYSHVTPHMQAEAAAALDNLLATHG